MDNLAQKNLVYIYMKKNNVIVCLKKKNNKHNNWYSLEGFL